MKTILIVSPEAWGPNFVSKHHYANYLSKEYRVFFIDPPKKFNLFRLSVEERDEKENLKIIQYSNILPKLDKFPIFIQKIIYKIQARKIVKRLNIKELDIVWSFDPHRFFKQTIWLAKKTIYHSVDYHHSPILEVEIIKSSDLNLTISHDFYKSYNIDLSSIKEINHAVDIDSFNQINNSITLPGQNKLKAGLVANFRNLVNFDLIYEVCSQIPNCDFIFIGPTSDSNLSAQALKNSDEFNNLTSLKNVYFIGAKEFSTLPSYLNKIDINLLCYSIRVTNSHKILMYLLSGKVVLSTPVKQYPVNDNTLLIQESTNQGFVNKLNEICENIEQFNSETAMNIRKEHAKKSSYEIKINQILSELYN